MYKRGKQGWLKHIDFILWDLLILQVSFVLAFLIRFGWNSAPYGTLIYKSLAVVLTAVDFLIMFFFNTLHNVMKRGYVKEFTASLKQSALLFAVMTLYLFTVQSGETYSRITLYLTVGIHIVLGYLFRLFWKRVVRKINREKTKDTMILVADENQIPEILEKADALDEFRYSGIILSNRDGTGETIGGIEVVSGIEHAADYICRNWVDGVFVYPEHLSDLRTVPYEAIETFIDETKAAQAAETGKPAEERSGVAGFIEQCREMAIPVHIGLPITGAGGNGFIEKVGGYSVLTMTANSVSPVQLLAKRLLDIAGGLIGSIAALILMAFIGPKIKKESPGPILFKQIRIGKNGKRFRFYKIRSMYMDAEERKKELMEQNRIPDGMMFKMDFDPRIIGNRIVDGKQVTGIGEKIRSASLDEFPQFFNVLKGDMSLVGTRPPTEDEWERYKYHHRARLAAKPGLTGLWQVSGRSRITDFEEVVRLDTEYISNWSITLDLKILAKTFRTVLKKDGAM